MSSDTTSNDVHHWYMKPTSISSISSRFLTPHINQTSINIIYYQICTIKHQSISYNVIIYHLYFWLTMTWWSAMVNSAKMPRITWPPSGRGALGSVLKESRAARRSKSASMVLQALISSWTMGGHWEIIGYIIYNNTVHTCTYYTYVYIYYYIIYYI